MKFEATRIPDVIIIHQEPRRDHRGEFARIFCADEMTKAGMVASYPQENRSRCTLAGTLRGLHFQVAPHSEAKLLRCTRGSIYDVAVDCREGSPTFLQWIGVELDEFAGKMIYVPPGFAHGYQALEDGAEVSYRTSAIYHAAAERQIRYDDLRIGIDWPLSDPLLSAKDASVPPLSDEFTGVAT